MAAKNPLLRSANGNFCLEFARTRTRVPFSISVGQRGLLCGGGLLRGTTHSALLSPRGEGSLVVWGCMSGQGDGQLYRCEGTMRQDQYVRVLRNLMLPSASSLYGEGESFVFQRDNAPCQKANTVTRFLERSHVEVLQWPAQSHT